ncbi:MAG: hypothetical protein QXR85_00610 [Candidatus Micrarchaeaceae archaeon]
MLLKRRGLEGTAKILIITGLLLLLFSWLAAAHYYGIFGKPVLFLAPFIFTCIMALLLLVIKYRYVLFEKYPYLINLPSLFYHVRKQNTNNQSIAFSMIFTVHALVVAFMGLLSSILTISISISIPDNAAHLFLYVYLAVIAILVISVFLQYRRIYIKLTK